jgi:hypothetical protein
LELVAKVKILAHERDARQKAVLDEAFLKDQNRDVRIFGQSRSNHATCRAT